jgi:hypothetical protein
MKREFNRKGGARSARRVTVRAKNFAGERGGSSLRRRCRSTHQVCQKTDPHRKRIMKSVLLVDDDDESALSPGDNWLPRAIGR